MSFLTNLDTGFNQGFLPRNRRGEFSDPFLLPSNESFPTQLSNAFDFCAHLWYLNSTYRQASIRVCSHFITDIDFEGRSGDRRERNELYDLLMDSVQIKLAMLRLGMEFSCFQGDTLVVTEDYGNVPIRTLAGNTVRVLSKDGRYRPATFRSYGVQPLREITFSDKRKVLATPEHRWEVRNGAGNIREVTTDELKPASHTIERVVAARPEKNEEYHEGVRHGFVFGDGTRNNRYHRENHQARAYFWGEKDAVMKPFFKGCGTGDIRLSTYRDYLEFLSGLPPHYKELPDPKASASYWYGFVSGFLAADGSVDTHGCALLTQASEATMRAVEKQLPRIGMVGGEFRSQVRDTEIGGRVYKDHEMFLLTLLKQFMCPEDFLIEHHRANFEANWDPDSKYGQRIGIKSVCNTGLSEEVFCCDEPETHRFVIDNGILTSNCYGNGFAWMYFPFNRYLVDNRDREHPREWALENFEKYGKVEYIWRDMEYDVVDPLTIHKPRNKWKRVRLPFRDRQTLDLEEIRILMLDPRQITLRSARWSGHTEVIWRFDAQFLDDVQNNKLYQVNHTPINMLAAVAQDQDFLFHDDEVFHLKAPTISGISNFGWGLPEVLANYRELHQIQVYRKIIEAVGMDYILPFRIFSPNVSGQGIGENTYYTMLGNWQAEVETLIRNRRMNPFSIHAMPFPVTYEEHGAAGKELAPHESMQMATDNMLDGMGYPAELWHGSLQIAQIPTSLRLFENSKQYMFRGFHNFLKWVTRKIQVHGSMEDIEVALQLPRLADDLEKRPIYLQLAAGGELSRALAWRDIGVDDPVEAYRERKEEDAEFQKVDEEIGERLQREQQLGSLSEQVMSEQAGAAGGMPADAAGGMTPLDTMRQAEEEAQSIITMDRGSQQKAWEQLRAGDPNYYAMVKQKAEEYRRGAEQQGRASLQQGG